MKYVIIAALVAAVAYSIYYVVKKVLNKKSVEEPRDKNGPFPIEDKPEDEVISKAGKKGRPKKK